MNLQPSTKSCITVFNPFQFPWKFETTSIFHRPKTISQGLPGFNENGTVITGSLGWGCGFSSSSVLGRACGVFLRIMIGIVVSQNFRTEVYNVVYEGPQLKTQGRSGEGKLMYWFQKQSLIVSKNPSLLYIRLELFPENIYKCHQAWYQAANNILRSSGLRGIEVGTIQG